METRETKEGVSSVNRRANIALIRIRKVKEQLDRVEEKIDKVIKHINDEEMRRKITK